MQSPLPCVWAPWLRGGQALAFAYVTPHPGPKTGRQWPGQPSQRPEEGPDQTTDRISQNLQYDGEGAAGCSQACSAAVGDVGPGSELSLIAMGLQEGATLSSIPSPVCVDSPHNQGWGTHMGRLKAP